jgi:L-fuconolactonase
VGLDITGNYRYPAPSIAWLHKHTEEIIEPDRPIIDAHHHIWEQDGNAYLLDDLVADVVSGHNVKATVFVEARYGYRASGPQELRCLGETEKIRALVEEARKQRVSVDVCAAIVAHADLRLGRHVTSVIEGHLASAPDRLRGVRQSVARDPEFPNGIVLRPAPAGLLADLSYREGLRTLAEYDLSYDAMLYHRQIPELTATARALPQLPIILDHFGCIIGVGPYKGREGEIFQRWRSDLEDLAQCPNVSIKLGGLGMIICGAEHHLRETPPSSSELAQAWRPHVETCIELFGTRRCLFESNFPVDKAMFSYHVLWNAYKRIVAGASESEKSDLFHDTAAQVYRIG